MMRKYYTPFTCLDCKRCILPIPCACRTCKVNQSKVLAFHRDSHYAKIFPVFVFVLTLYYKMSNGRLHEIDTNAIPLTTDVPGARDVIPETGKTPSVGGMMLYSPYTLHLNKKQPVYREFMHEKFDDMVSNQSTKSSRG